MVVTVEAALGVTVVGIIAGQVPDDQALVARSGEEHVGAVKSLEFEKTSSPGRRRRKCPVSLDISAT